MYPTKEQGLLQQHYGIRLEIIDKGSRRLKGGYLREWWSIAVQKLKTCGSILEDESTRRGYMSNT